MEMSKARNFNFGFRTHRLRWSATRAAKLPGTRATKLESATINRQVLPPTFYRTGDMVRLHAAGNLIVEGRRKDPINRGGEKISAEEIENLIIGHENIDMVAVVAMPDAVMGERACAFVTLKPGCSMTLDQLTRFLQDKRIANYKLPERLEIVESLPLIGMGKVSKKDLRETIVAKLKVGEVITERAATSWHK